MSPVRQFFVIRLIEKSILNTLLYPDAVQSGPKLRNTLSTGLAYIREIAQSRICCKFSLCRNSSCEEYVFSHGKAIPIPINVNRDEAATQ
jgi:hypothetical protein